MTDLPTEETGDSEKVKTCPMCGEVLKQTEILIADPTKIQQILMKCRPAVLIVSFSCILVALTTVTKIVNSWDSQYANETFFEKLAAFMYYGTLFARALGFGFVGWTAWEYAKAIRIVVREDPSRFDEFMIAQKWFCFAMATWAALGIIILIADYGARLYYFSGPSYFQP